MNYSADIPVRGTYDVVVVGAGPAGIGAAVTSARLGRKTLLVEKYGYPGGVGTYGCCTIFFRFGEHGRQLVSGLAEEVIRRMDARGAASLTINDGCGMPEFRRIGDRPLLGKVITKTEDLRVVYHDILSESGVEKLFYSHLCGVIRDGRRVRGIVVDSLEGPGIIESKVFVDASGDAHLVHRAGGRTEQAAADETMHKSVFFMVSGVTPHDPQVNIKRYQELFKAGAVPDKFWNHLGYSYQLDPGIVQLAFAYANGDACSSADMTRMDHELRDRNFEAVEFMKREMVGYEHCFPVNSAQQVCVRSSRHICGVTKLTEELLAKDELPPAPLMYIVRSYGSHSTDQKKGFAPAKRGTLGGFSAIPYGALIPVEFDNVLASGRCISVDECVMDTIRMMTTCMVTGQAAGIAASIAIAGDLSEMTEVPYGDLRQGLLNMHCILD
ncbi:MAG: hypothetical protein A3K19_28830 [Lentisphaerae bacterium RIFOXYB12_FULL_65_16]|nr:MAG: hypothetical protein A3K18_25415 [Lentisphaerae bacterium RIFOXYA12_64_32]OGV88299.1 MAG: hypothetical protein A3K19_28830 [Lentisphaerae bacterium RIFOXYB12_FULL_65_16]